MIITRKLLKRHLPALLLRHRRLTNKIAVVRKRDAHDPRLPENRLAKAQAAQQEAANQIAAERLAALAKQKAKADALATEAA